LAQGCLAPSRDSPGIRIAETIDMRRSRLRSRSIGWGIAACVVAMLTALVSAQMPGSYRIEHKSDRTQPLQERFTVAQLAVLEKLNRADVAHLQRLREVVVPESWSGDELSYSVLPTVYPSSERWPKFVVIHVPGQVFGAYEFGRLVRWGPISSGRRDSPTVAGRLTLNWRSKGRASTIDPDWFMRWYFNFDNREGLAMHSYSLPGYPASHGCIRLLERDAQWLFEWGQPWTLDGKRQRVVTPGTPLLIVGKYDFEAAPPWRSLEWLSAQLELPVLPTNETF
jgi:hypothetical protein